MNISILNDVLGPIMHGPSSSHTAASYNIGRLTRMLCANDLKELNIIFDSKGSFAKTYKAQNGDLAFLAGLMDIPVDDPQYNDSINIAEKRGIKINFTIKDLSQADHPNYMIIDIPLKDLTIIAKSIGGGMVLIEKINSWKVDINGSMYNLLIEFESTSYEKVLKVLSLDMLEVQKKDKKMFMQIKSEDKSKEKVINKLNSLKEITNLWITSPVKYPIRGTPLFKNASEILNQVVENLNSIGEIGLESESKTLKLDKQTIINEIRNRIEIMFDSIEKGLEKKNSSMKLLDHSASKIQAKERKLLSSGINIRSAYRAMAAMDTASSGGLICAAPTGASCGVLAAVLYTLHYDLKIDINKIIKCALAAGVIGLLNGMNSTFAAEIAGCQVEIGMAGAMAAAAVIEAVDGTPHQATNAASIALQNTMGSVCDLVAGFCEIPCHTRNAVAASNAFICADLVLGGYINLINLDDSILASYESGKMLPPQLRCTSQGGIAITESAKKLERQ